MFRFGNFTNFKIFLNLGIVEFRLGLAKRLGLAAGKTWWTRPCTLSQTLFIKNLRLIFWNGSHASPLQRGFKKTIAENVKLGRKYANFLFFFLSINKFAFA